MPQFPFSHREAIRALRRQNVSYHQQSITPLFIKDLMNSKIAKFVINKVLNLLNKFKLKVK